MCIFTAQDFPPVANAGPDIDIQLPIDFASFSGSKSTDDVGIVRYEWSIDDDSVKLIDADSMDASVTGLAAGQYTLTLTVYDEKDQSDTDDMVINVAGLTLTGPFLLIYFLYLTCLIVCKSSKVFNKLCNVNTMLYPCTIIVLINLLSEFRTNTMSVFRICSYKHLCHYH